MIADARHIPYDGPKLREETELHRRIVQADDGLWWPAQVGGGRYKWPSAVTDADPAVELCRGRSVAVQAGGHVGLWPRYLSGLFDRVYTFEPDPVNWQCLVRNVVGFPTIIPFMSALGEREAVDVPWRRSLGNTGKHKVATKGAASHKVVMMALDYLPPPACDLICLDVEGYELPALKGAANTIEKYRPVIMVEDAGHAKAHGYRVEQLWAWLEERGYREEARVGEYDHVWAPPG